MPESTALVLLSDFQAVQVEFWRHTQYPGYDVSNFGRIRSYWTSTGRGWRSGFTKVIGNSPKIIKQTPSVKGYMRVHIAAKKGLEYVHRLVAEAFLPNPNGLSTVNHKTFNKSDNREGVLEWTTQRRNNQHAWENGIMDNHFKVILTDITAHAAWLMKESGLPQHKIAGHLGVSQGTITHLFTGKLKRYFPEYAEKQDKAT